MRLLERFNAVPGSPGSALHGRLAALPRLVFDHTSGHGLTATPTPMRYPPGAKAVAAFAAWAQVAGRFEVAPARDRRALAELETRLVLAGTPVRVWVPVMGLPLAEAIGLVDQATRAVAVRG
ncbi:hypothetical protein GCM10027447_01910 [Glycomyces halotolerans]